MADGGWRMADVLRILAEGVAAFLQRIEPLEGVQWIGTAAAVDVVLLSGHIMIQSPMK